MKEEWEEGGEGKCARYPYLRKTDMNMEVPEA
jgi:hypothetical protein